MILTRISELIFFLNLWSFIYSIICSINVVKVVSFVRRVSLLGNVNRIDYPNSTGVGGKGGNQEKVRGHSNPV